MKRFLRICSLILLLSLISCADSTKILRRTVPSIPGASDEMTAAPESALPEPPPDPIVETARISVVAAGDNVIHRAIWTDAMQRGGEGKYDFAAMYADTADYIAAFDVAFINQETLMAESFELATYPRFNSPQDAGRTLRDIGFDV